MDTDRGVGTMEQPPANHFSEPSVGGHPDQIPAGGSVVINTHNNGDSSLRNEDGGPRVSTGDVANQGSSTDAINDLHNQIKGNADPTRNEHAQAVPPFQLPPSYEQQLTNRKSEGLYAGSLDSTQRKLRRTRNQSYQTAKL
jgi:hypothetical protein